MLPGEDEVALVLADVADEDVVESAVVDASEDKDVSRRADEEGRETEASPIWHMDTRTNEVFS